jgi:hypothetical protein
VRAADPCASIAGPAGPTNEPERRFKVAKAELAASRRQGDRPALVSLKRPDRAVALLGARSAGMMTKGRGAWRCCSTIPVAQTDDRAGRCGEVLPVGASGWASASGRKFASVIRQDIRAELPQRLVIRGLLEQLHQRHAAIQDVNNHSSKGNPRHAAASQKPRRRLRIWSITDPSRLVIPGALLKTAFP